MKHYDYSTPNYYFVTICTKDKRCLFGNAGHLNTLGQIARDRLLETSAHFPEVTVDKYVVMPNHIHAILILRQQNVQLTTIIGQYKAAVTKEARAIYPDIDIWQTSFHDHIIRNQASYEKNLAVYRRKPSKMAGGLFLYRNSCTLLTTHESLPGRRGHDPALQNRMRKDL